MLILNKKGLKSNTPTSTLRKKKNKRKISKRNKIIRMRVEINDIEDRKAIKKTNETNITEKISKIDKLLARLIRIEREKIQMISIRSEKGDIITGSTYIKRIIGNTCTPTFIAALFTIAERWKQPKCPSTDE